MDIFPQEIGRDISIKPREGCLIPREMKGF